MLITWLSISTTELWSIWECNNSKRHIWVLPRYSAFLRTTVRMTQAKSLTFTPTFSSNSCQEWSKSTQLIERLRTLLSTFHISFISKDKPASIISDRSAPTSYNWFSCSIRIPSKNLLWLIQLWRRAINNGWQHSLMRLICLFLWWSKIGNNLKAWRTPRLWRVLTWTLTEWAASVVRRARRLIISCFSKNLWTSYTRFYSRKTSPSN